MGFKKSLGFSPLGFGSSGESELDFVGAEQKGTGNGSSGSVYDDLKATAQNNFTFASSFSDKVKKKAEEHEDTPEKKVASYYLEKETLRKLKQWADEKKMTYSSVVEQAIRTHLATVAN